MSRPSKPMQHCFMDYQHFVGHVCLRQQTT
jgi:hypothetical protein